MLPVPGWPRRGRLVPQRHFEAIRERPSKGCRAVGESMAMGHLLWRARLFSRMFARGAAPIWRWREDRSWAVTMDSWGGCLLYTSDAADDMQ
eukprot:13068317-Alexandrium_andersonii.AAC.2